MSLDDDFIHGAQSAWTCAKKANKLHDCTVVPLHALCYLVIMKIEKKQAVAYLCYTKQKETRGWVCAFAILQLRHTLISTYFCNN